MNADKPARRLASRRAEHGPRMGLAVGAGLAVVLVLGATTGCTTQGNEDEQAALDACHDAVLRITPGEPTIEDESATPGPPDGAGTVMTYTVTGTAKLDGTTMSWTCAAGNDGDTWWGSAMLY